MANREALRELQQRLAERMQAAKREQRGQSWLAVECRGQGLLLPLEQAGEIFPPAALMPVPHTRTWFAGVANLRGGLHGVVDLARFLGLPEVPAGEAGREQSRLVAFSHGLGLNCALLVDRLAGLRSAEQLNKADDGDDTARPAFAPTRWLDAAGRSWQSLDLAALARDEQFLSIVA
ncbi:MAG TPA: chemotaxis protein CheW [Burkholderiaceae bacterium]|jgi:twitching motility protein PilI|nr:chemotaxis protein CheW [Burkholderiaceae bacterium]